MTEDRCPSTVMRRLTSNQRRLLLVTMRPRSPNSDIPKLLPLNAVTSSCRSSAVRRVRPRLSCLDVFVFMPRVYHAAGNLGMRCRIGRLRFDRSQPKRKK